MLSYVGCLRDPCSPRFAVCHPSPTRPRRNASRRPPGPRIRSYCRRGAELRAHADWRRTSRRADAGHRAGGGPRAAGRDDRRRSADLADNPVFPLRAPEDLERLCSASLHVEGRALEPLRLLALADYLESIDTSAAAVRRSGGEFPRLRALVGRAPSFKDEIDGRAAQDRVSRATSLDHASPLLASLRDRLRRQRTQPAQHARVVPARQGDRRSICRTRSSPSAMADSSCS